MSRNQQKTNTATVAVALVSFALPSSLSLAVRTLLTHNILEAMTIIFRWHELNSERVCVQDLCCRSLLIDRAMGIISQWEFSYPTKFRSYSLRLMTMFWIQLFHLTFCKKNIFMERYTFNWECLLHTFNNGITSRIYSIFLFSYFSGKRFLLKCSLVQWNCKWFAYWEIFGTRLILHSSWTERGYTLDHITKNVTKMNFVV